MLVSIMRLKYWKDFPQHNFSFLKNTAAYTVCENLFSLNTADKAISLIFTEQLQDHQASLFTILQFLQSKATVWLFAKIHTLLFFIETVETAGDLSGHFTLFFVTIRMTHRFWSNGTFIDQFIIDQLHFQIWSWPFLYYLIKDSQPAYSQS